MGELIVHSEQTFFFKSLKQRRIYQGSRETEGGYSTDRAAPPQWDVLLSLRLIEWRGRALNKGEEYS